jgi:hypothetical protein
MCFATGFRQIMGVVAYLEMIEKRMTELVHSRSLTVIVRLLISAIDRCREFDVAVKPGCTGRCFAGIVSVHHANGNGQHGDQLHSP